MDLVLYYKINQLDETLINRQALHAYRMEFQHPITKQRMEFVAKIPADMEKIIK